MKQIYLTFLLAIILLGGQAQPSSYKYKYQVDSILYSDKSVVRFQIAAFYYSLIGEYEADLKVYDHYRQKGDIAPVSSTQKEFFSKYHPIEAESYIIEQAKKTSIVIINEGHNHPEHRLFVSRLLPGLKKIGYNYIGFEAFEYGDADLNSRKYPMLVQFNYTNDACFGNLIRKACALNYKVFPYEARIGTSNKEREIQEADNIVHVIKSSPTAKFVIYCGYDHAIEDSLTNWGLAMAGRVKRLTGVDPLTIDQVQLTETSDTVFDNPYRRLINLNYPAVFINNENKAFNKANEAKSFDMNIYHPQTEYVKGRPAWLKDAGNRYLNISGKINIDFPCLVFAYMPDDDMGKAVPVDVIELDTKSDIKNMVLPKGRIKIKAINPKGQLQIIQIK